MTNSRALIWSLDFACILGPLSGEGRSTGLPCRIGLHSTKDHLVYSIRTVKHTPSSTAKNYATTIIIAIVIVIIIVIVIVIVVVVVAAVVVVIVIVIIIVIITLVINNIIAIII